MIEGTVDSDDKVCWYVLRVTYQRELLAKDKLVAMGISCFVTMTTVKQLGSNGRYTKKKVAALHNYLFVQSTRKQIDEVKHTKIPWLRYVMVSMRDKSKHVMIVPDKQMQSFITIVQKEDERTMFLNPDEVHLSQGDRVVVTGGPFEGVEGVLMRVGKRARGRSVVVKIDGVAAVATAVISSDLVQRIDDARQ